MPSIHSGKHLFGCESLMMMQSIISDQSVFIAERKAESIFFFISHGDHKEVNEFILKQSITAWNMKTDRILLSLFTTPVSLSGPTDTLLGLNLLVMCMLNPHGPSARWAWAPMICILEQAISQRVPSLTVISFTKTAPHTLIDNIFRTECELSHRLELKIRDLTGIHDCWELVEAEMRGKASTLVVNHKKLYVFLGAWHFQKPAHNYKESCINNMSRNNVSIHAFPTGKGCCVWVWGQHTWIDKRGTFSTEQTPGSPRDPSERVWDPNEKCFAGHFKIKCLNPP